MDALVIAERDTGLDAFPESTPWAVEEIFADDCLPA